MELINSKEQHARMNSRDEHAENHKNYNFFDSENTGERTYITY